MNGSATAITRIHDMAFLPRVRDGVRGVEVPAWLVVPVLLALAVGVAWWAHKADLRLVVLGVGLIAASYLLVYSARAEWGYEEVKMSQTTWSRYHLLPQLGLALVVAGGLRGWLPGWAGEGLSRQQGKVVLILTLGRPGPLLGGQGPGPLHYLQNGLRVALGQAAHHVQVLVARRIPPGNFDQQVVAHDA